MALAGLVSVAFYYSSGVTAGVDSFPGESLPYEAALLAMALQVVPLLDGSLLLLGVYGQRGRKRVLMECVILGAGSVWGVAYCIPPVEWWSVIPIPGLLAIAYLAIEVNRRIRVTQ